MADVPTSRQNKNANKTCNRLAFWVKLSSNRRKSRKNDYSVEIKYNMTKLQSEIYKKSKGTSARDDTSTGFGCGNYF